MSLLSPAALLLALLLPVIVAMYLLKLRRTEQVVSSTYLWRQIVRDLEANAPWQRLRRNLLLFLQLLFLAVLILAVARPFTWSKGITGQALIVVLDSSASMASTDVPPNRLEAAKEQARQLVDQLPDGARITVIDAGRKARVIASSSADIQQVRRAIDEIKPGAGGSDMGIALQLASAIALRQPDTQTVVLSDGNVTLPDRLSLSGTVTYIPVGSSADNQGIQLLTLQTLPGSGNVAAFAQVFNYSETPVSRRIALYGDGRLSNVYDLDIPANGEQSVVMEDLPGGTRLVEARLLPDAQVVDYLSTDDSVMAVHRQTEPVSVTLVTNGNLFLETALALLPGLKITAVDPTAVDPTAVDPTAVDPTAVDPTAVDPTAVDPTAVDPTAVDPTAVDPTAVDPAVSQTFPSADLTILDRYVPEATNLPSGNLFFIAPPQGTQFFDNNGIIEAPKPQAADTGSDALAMIENVNLDEINILDAVRIPLPTWAQPEIVCTDTTLGEATTSPLLFTGEIDGRRLAVLAFDLHRSDLPLQIAFPILLSNLIQWLAPGQAGVIPSQVVPGEAMSFSLPLGSQSKVTITHPDGTTTQLEVESSRVVFADTDQIGLYRIDLGDKQSYEFVANMLSSQESRIKPIASLPVLQTTASEQEKGMQRARKEWWRYAGVVALALLVIEWLVYNRSAMVKISKQISSSVKKSFSHRS